MTYAPQVDRSHYAGKAYRSSERWNSYWHQLVLVRRTSPLAVLEIGPGEGVVTDALRKDGIAVTTVDIAPDLRPDVVGSITALPLPDKAFDMVLAAEVLEHIRFEDVPQALREMARVARLGIVIALPHPGYVFSFVVKLPLLPRLELFFQLPFFWKRHVFNGEHYWELGKRGYSQRHFLKCAGEAGLKLVASEKHADDPAHRSFLFSVI